MKLNKKIVGAIFFVVIVIAVAGIAIAQTNYGGDGRVYYSLDSNDLDTELIKIIDNSKEYVYFAIYFFTKEDIARALIEAKRRGVEVVGIMDREASTESNREIYTGLVQSGIRVETQKHNPGIMHIKALVSEKAYASGSFNWTESADKINDEVLEIGTDDSLRRQYLGLIKKIIQSNSRNADEGTVSDSGGKSTGKGAVGDGEYSISEAPDHIGENAVVYGEVKKVFVSKSKTTFIDFCDTFADCPFSAVIFSGDADKFAGIDKMSGKVRIKGDIKSYKGKAEIVVNDPKQIMID